ncbi:putative general secretion pathway protein [Marinomonas sp. MED121]|uniref:type II secretion system protein N n=1 Tax=Marinomonas sp. MED121 TaxID=314277 RepID=UPI0000690D33|nr:type II secretion system protein N [Marinomonas sp. MED121]EAQ65211.1 putative general secretion pathway protein [Marinomonas sp. MED121]
MAIPRVGAIFRFICLFAFVSLSAFSAARVFWSFSPMPAQTLAPIDFNASQKTRPQLTLPSSSLFGFVAKVEQEIKEPTKKTTLKLTLKGVMPAIVMQDSMAIISSKSKKDEVYRIDDQIIRGVLLKEVYQDHVILERSGKSESLYFGETKLTTLIENSDDLEVAEIKKTRPDLSRNKAADTLTPQEILSTYEALFKEDPDALLASTGLKSTGNAYEVLASSSLIAMGLKAGDKIVAVNGQSVGNVENDAGLGELVREQSVANFQIQRGSRTFSVSYPIK